MLAHVAFCLEVMHTHGTRMHEMKRVPSQPVAQCLGHSCKKHFRLCMIRSKELNLGFLVLCSLG